jgi:hypothetical protein
MIPYLSANGRTGISSIQEKILTRFDPPVSISGPLHIPVLRLLNGGASQQ